MERAELAEIVAELREIRDRAAALALRLMDIQQPFDEPRTDTVLAVARLNEAIKAAERAR